MNLREFRRILLQALYFPIVLLLLLAAFFLMQIRVSSVLLKAIVHSDQITNQVSDLQTRVLDQQAGVRGYELTHDDKMLVPYTAAKDAIDADFKGLHGLLTGDAAQTQRLTELSDRYQLWLGMAEKILGHDSTRAENAQAYQRSEQMMNAIRATTGSMLKVETVRREILSRRTPDLEHSQFVQILSASLCIAMAVALFMRRRLQRVSRSYTSAINELEQRTSEISQSRQWFRTTLESIGDAVISCDIRGRVEFLNAVAGGLTEWTMQDALGRPLTEVFHIVNEETRAQAENPVDEVLREKRPVGTPHHTMLISKAGKEILIDDSAAPVVNADGGMTGVVLVFRDVTEQRRSEAALIAGEKLAVAGRLAASIAHEIHNPLDSVMNLLFLLRDETDPERRGEFLQMAEQELGRTMQISRTMLSLYREPKAPVMIDLKDLIEGVLLLLERRISQQQVQIKSELQQACSIEGFPAELRQVVTNILVNGIEAAGLRGHLRVRLAAAPPEELRGAGAVIEVADSGAGVAEDAAKRIFTPFFTTKGEQGTGLGLWVSMGIVQKHGGTIRLQNCGEDVYTGACARVYLPAKTLAVTAGSAAPHAA